MERFRDKWYEVDIIQARSLLACTGYAGHVFPLSIHELPPQLQKMSGLSAAYTSGYVDWSQLKGMTAIAEFVVIRSDAGIEKGYNFLIATSGHRVFFNGPYKLFDGHHFDPRDAAPLDSLFGNVPPVDSLQEDR